jgi:hypothetical protein
MPTSRGAKASPRDAPGRERSAPGGNRRARIPLFVQAAEQYAAALGKWKHPVFYFNLAIAQLNLGHEVEARESLVHALQYGEEPLGAGQFHEAQKQLQDLERQLGRLRITCQAAGAEVALDGVTVFVGPGSYEGWAKAKDHEVTAKKAGYLPVARQVPVSSGKLEDVELRLITLSEATDASRRWAAWKPWAVVAAGVAITATGGGFDAFAARNFNAFDTEFSKLLCARDHGCQKEDVSDRLNDRLTRARQQQAVAVGGYVIGGSLIATGIVLLYLNKPRLTEGAASSSVNSVAVVPAVSGDMLGILAIVNH